MYIFSSDGRQKPISHNLQRNTEMAATLFLDQPRQNINKMVN